IKTGAPLVQGAKVTGEVIGQGKESKIYVFKFKRRKNYRRKTGHRQGYTEVRITDLKLG
ncbi:MAG: 50S ribosomal protein L21, partial [Gemmatimonadales bacterium]